MFPVKQLKTEGMKSITDDAEVVGTFPDFSSMSYDERMEFINKITKNLTITEEEEQAEKLKKLKHPDRMYMDLMMYGSEMSAMNDFWYLLTEKYQDVPYNETQIVNGFRHAWAHTEILYPYKDILDYMLENVSHLRHIFMKPNENKFFQKLPNRFKVYRGASRDGYSWTLSKKKAEWFADRNRQRYSKEDTRVMEKWVNKKDVFAYINGRKEQEIIIPMK